MPCRLQPPGGSSPGGLWLALLLRTNRDLDQKTKQTPPPPQQKTCPLLAMLRYVLGLLILQMPVRAATPVP